MPRGRKNRRRRNNNSNWGSQQSSTETTEQSGQETENSTADVETVNTACAEAPATPEMIPDLDNLTENQNADDSSESILANLTDHPNAVGQVENTASSLVSEIEGLISDYGRRLQLLSDTKGHLLQTAENVKKEFDERLHRLKNDLTDKLHRNVEEEHLKLRTKMEQCKAMQSEMEAAKEEHDAAIESNDPIRVIMAYNRSTEALKQNNEMMKEMKRTHEFVKIKHKIDREDFRREGLSLGRIEVTREKREFPVPGIESDPE